MAAASSSSALTLWDPTQISRNNMADFILHVWMKQRYGGFRFIADLHFPGTLAGALLSYRLQETSPTICSQSYILKVVFFLT